MPVILIDPLCKGDQQTFKCLLLIRCERLEDQLNDLTELHQNETANLKQELASIEERVAYQAHERARDIQVQQNM